MKNQNLFYLLSLLTVFTFFSCEEDPIVTDPTEMEEMEMEMEMEEMLVVDFQPSASKINEGETITFESSVQGNPSSYSWTFEGGTPSTSDESNPQVTFNTFGNHKISLVISRDSDATSATIEKEIVVCPGAGMVAYFPLDGNALDQSGNNFDGSITGATNIENYNGEADSAMDFDGDDYIETSAMIDDQLKEGATFSTWINVKEMGSEWSRFITNYSGSSPGGNCLERVGFIASITEDAGIRITYASDGNDFVGRISSPNTIAINQWHHITCLWRGEFESSSFEIYIDGQRADSEDFEDGFVNCGGLLESPLPFNFGRGFCAAGECGFFTGSIDEVRIYDRPLSEDEIAILAQ